MKTVTLFLFALVTALPASAACVKTMKVKSEDAKSGIIDGVRVSGKALRIIEDGCTVKRVLYTKAELVAEETAAHQKRLERIKKSSNP